MAIRCQVSRNREASVQRLRRLIEAGHNQSWDRSGGGAFCIIIGPVGATKNAPFDQPFGVSRSFIVK